MKNIDCNNSKAIALNLLDQLYRESSNVREVYAAQNDVEKKQNTLISKYTIDSKTKQ